MDKQPINVNQESFPHAHGIIQDNYDIKHPKCLPKIEMFQHFFKLRCNLATRQKPWVPLLFEPWCEPPTDHCGLECEERKQLSPFLQHTFSGLHFSKSQSLLISCCFCCRAPEPRWQLEPKATRMRNHWTWDPSFLGLVNEKVVRVRCEALLKVNSALAAFLFLALLAVKIKIQLGKVFPLAKHSR